MAETGAAAVPETVAHQSIKDDQSNRCQRRRTQLTMSSVLPLLAVARWRVEQEQCRRCRRRLVNFLILLNVPQKHPGTTP